MSADRIEIDVKMPRLGSFTLILPGPFDLGDDQLDRAMERCNRFFGDPARELGGPRCTTPEENAPQPKKGF